MLNCKYQSTTQATGPIGSIKLIDQTTSQELKNTWVKMVHFKEVTAIFVNCDVLSENIHV